MEKEFVPHELAVKLKELGFDNLCLCHYNYGNILRSKIVSYVEGDCLKLDKFDKSTPATLWQQAFDWFRNDKQETAWIEACFDKYFFHTRRGHQSKDFTTYEQARHACLEELIELIQNKNDRSI